VSSAYCIGAGFVLGAGVFFILFYERIEHALFIEKTRREQAERKLHALLTDGLPETQVSDEEWESLVERMRGDAKSFRRKGDVP
jgi:hypothetical protein